MATSVRGAMMVQATVAVALFVLALLAPEVAAQLGVLSSGCTADADCGPGLYCFSCEGAAPKCTANQALSLSSFAQTYSLPYNKYAWITTHNAYAIEGETSVLGAAIISPKNQEDTVTNQLNRGVRGLMLDIYEFKGDLWLCHSIGTCYDFTAFRPLNSTLLEISAFLAANPNEVITIFIEDYVTTPFVLSNHFKATGLSKYMLPSTSMPKDGSDWPTVASMIASNQRFVVFTSDSKKEASEGIAYQWNYVVENQYGTLAETCTNRAESSVLTDRTKSLILENYFPNDPNITEACVINSGYLAQAITVCYAAAGNRWSNFLAVDFYKRSTSGGVFSAVDTLNGQHHCGCNDIRLCQANGQGSCQIPAATYKALLTPAQTPAPAPDSSSTYITASKFSLRLTFFISFISFFHLGQ
ncbi:hypothetical protein M758_8G091700 [Ceratodon purpureus]|uniref:PI-PLC X domain-containing protein n=1 Tax=Ceratodon purpureus TaxID=3225 RepID=A0A8T0H2C4_CERPU|nr:hypothetical protein KC19_8G095700 [Ceratodon purpureus]KAG0608257.1 hypothetical protein M758_8G091700 [Ceratodon purpureus]